ncbi:MAG: cysteine-rich CWC family protein [Acidobacteriota bacterium]
MRRILAIISPRWRKPYDCERCGQKTVCGATFLGCWCSEFKLSEQVRSDLRGKYARCLCRECMERLSLDGASRD